MNLGEMFAHGPTMKVKPAKGKHVYPESVMKEWRETYRAIGVSERTAAEVIIKMNRVRKPGLPKLLIGMVIRRLRSMEKQGFVSQRKGFVAGSRKPVMFWKRVKKPCQ